MGIFHYTLIVVPSAFVDAHPELRQGALRKADLTERGLWRNQPSPDCLARLRGLWAHDNSWGDCEEYVSSHDDFCSDLRIWKDEADGVWSIDFRYCPAVDDIALLGSFLQILHDYGYKALSRESGAYWTPTLRLSWLT